MRTPVHIPVEAYWRKRFPLAYAMLDVWERWYSGKLKRFAVHLMLRYELAGIPPVIEDDREGKPRRM